MLDFIIVCLATEAMAINVINPLQKPTFEIVLLETKLLYPLSACIGFFEFIVNLAKLDSFVAIQLYNYLWFLYNSHTG